jgi:hypothetical protein
MKLFKPTTMAIFGIGFLAGSRSGRGAWNAFENKVSELQNRSSGGTTHGNGAGSMNSPEGGAMKEGALTEF